MSFGDFIKLPITLIVIILAIVTAVKGGLLNSFLATFGLLLYGGFFVFREKIVFWLEKRGWKKFYWWESLKEGGVKEAQIYRPLSEYERYVLKLRYLATKDKNFDLDQRSPVFRVIGNLLKNGEGEDEIAEVRGLKITKENSPPQLYQTFRDETDVAVEFSPFSKYVWDMYRVLGEKRIWRFHLPTKQIKSIKEDLQKVDLRAPFGSHNLKNLKVGDIIAYFDIGSLGVAVEIIGVTHYLNLEQAIKSEGLNEISPEAKDENDLTEYIKILPSYEARIKQSGVYAIRFKKVDL